MTLKNQLSKFGSRQTDKNKFYYLLDMPDTYYMKCTKI